MPESLLTSPPLELKWESKNWVSSTCANDSLQCLKLQVEFPIITEDNQISRQINDTLLANLHQLLIPTLPQVNTSFPIELGKWAQQLLHEYEELVAEDPEYRIPWEIKLITDSLYQNPFLLSIRMKFYAFTGGAHPNVQQRLMNFDLLNGHKVELRSIFKDERALIKMVEMKFLEEQRQSSSDQSIDGAITETIALPDNFAIMEEGLYFLYNPLEEVVYGLTLTEFFLPYKEIEDLLNQKGKTLFNKN